MTNETGNLYRPDAPLITVRFSKEVPQGKIRVGYWNARGTYEEGESELYLGNAPLHDRELLATEMASSFHFLGSVLTTLLIAPHYVLSFSQEDQSNFSDAGTGIETQFRKFIESTQEIKRPVLDD